MACTRFFIKSKKFQFRSWWYIDQKFCPYVVSNVKSRLEPKSLVACVACRPEATKIEKKCIMGWALWYSIDKNFMLMTKIPGIPNFEPLCSIGLRSWSGHDSAKVSTLNIEHDGTLSISNLRLIRTQQKTMHKFETVYKILCEF
jgi:hypothetical protein